MLKKSLFTLIFIVSTLCAGKFPVNSIEYSVSLKTDKFQNGMSDVKAFQKSLFDNIALARLDDDKMNLDTEELVSFWDTDEQLFHKHNIIVRLRGKEENFEVTLKYRGSDQEAAENWDMLASSKAKAKTEIDRYVNKDAFSRSITLSTKLNSLSSKMLLEMFPGLKEYGFTPEMKIKKVNGFLANSINYEVGKYRFGAENAKKKTTTSNFDLTIWKCDNGKVVAAEVSWKIRNEGVQMKPALDHAQEVLEKLSKNAEWSDQHPKTKTSISYDVSDICK